MESKVSDEGTGMMMVLTLVLFVFLFYASKASDRHLHDLEI